MNNYSSAYFSKSNVYNYLLFSLFIIFCNSILYLTSSIGLDITVMWMVTIYSIIYSKADILHPLTWFSTSFSLYSSAYAILYLIDNQTANYGYTHQNIQYSLIALSVVLLLVGGKRFTKLKNNNKAKMLDSDYEMVGWVLLMLACFSFLLTIILIGEGFTNKATMASSGPIFSGCTYSIRIGTFLCSVYILASDERKQFKKGIIIVFGSVVVLFAMQMAERDAILRFFLMLVLALWAKGTITKKMLIVIIPTGYFVMIFVNVLKYYFIDGTINPYYNNTSLLYQFLNTDFSAAGSNFQLLLNHSDSVKGCAGFKTIATDVLRSVIPKITFFNPSHWFNNYFFSGSSWNRAFTLVGEGYIIGGIIGIILLFLVIGILIRILINFTSKGIWQYAIYIYGAISVISSFRSTLGDMLVGIIRVPLLSIFIFYVAKKMLKKGI